MNAEIPRVVHREEHLRLVLVDQGGLQVVAEVRLCDALGDRCWAPVSSTTWHQQAIDSLGRYAAALLTRNAAELADLEPGRLLELAEGLAAALHDQARADLEAEDLARAAEHAGHARNLYRAAGMRGGWLD